MKLEEGCAQIAELFRVDPGVVTEAVLRALEKTGWEKGGYEFDDWQVSCRCADWNKRCDPRRSVIRRFTHEMNGTPLWPDIVNVTKEVAGKVRAVCIQRNCAPVGRKN